MLENPFEKFSIIEGNFIIKKHNMVKYSIITVCLNSEKTIERCLNSVKNQSYRSFEHIVIDGLSSDNTLTIVKSHITNYISEKDNGIFDAMNKGVKLSKGEYVLFLNSDDTLDSKYLEECDKIINEADFVSVGLNLIYSNRTIQWIPKNFDRLSEFIWRMPLPHPGLIVKKKIFNDLGGFDVQFRIAADFDFIIRLLKSNAKGVFLNKSLVNFYSGGLSYNLKIIAENHKIRSKYSNNIFLLFLAYLLDYLKYVQYLLNKH